MSIFALNSVGTAFLFAFILYYVAKFVYYVVFIYSIAPAVCKVDYLKLGKWALVTGCTDGIGKQYARELAERGCNIVLVSRSLDKLNVTAREIENDYNVLTKIIQADFSGDEEIYSKIEKEIEGLEIGTLVNNVGMSYEYPEYFLALPDCEELISKLIKTNIVSVTRMTKLVLPNMVKRDRGAVINIGSASSIIPSPLLTVYAASKAYVDKFTEGLEMEYCKYNILMQCVMPGFVCSNMSGIRRSSFFAPTAKDFVKSAIGLFGITSRTTGYLPHALFTNIINTLRDISEPFTVWLVIRSMENSRNKYMKKLKQQ